MLLYHAIVIARQCVISFDSPGQIFVTPLLWSCWFGLCAVPAHGSRPSSIGVWVQVIHGTWWVPVHISSLISQRHYLSRKLNLAYTMPHEAGEFVVQSISLVMLTPSYVIPLLPCALCCSGSQLKNEFYVCITSRLHSALHNEIFRNLFGCAATQSVSPCPCPISVLCESCRK